MSRLLKQFLYGFFYLAILAGLVYGIYLYIIYQQPASCFDKRLNQNETGIDCGGTCAPCGLENAQPLQLGTVYILPVNDRVVSVITEVKNPNLDFGVNSFDYHFNFYDSTGTSTLSVAGTSLIYPGEIKTIVEPAIALSPEQAKRGELVIDKLVWSAASDLPRPNIQTREVQSARTGNEVVISGLIINVNNYPLTRAVVSVVINDGFGLHLGATKTLLRDLASGEQRFFSATIPLLSNQDFDSAMTKIFVEPRR